MTIQVITRREDLAGISQRWDELAQNDPRDGFFRTSGWYRCWLDHIRQDAEPFVVVVRDTGDRIIGLAPLCQLTYSDLGFRLKGLSWAGREVVSGDFLDFVAENESRAEITNVILNFLWQMRSQWGLLIMGELVQNGDSYSALERLAQQNRLPVRNQEERICPFISLPGSFEEYLSTLSSSSRYHIRRRVRDVIDKHGARVEVYSQAADISAHLDTLIRLHLARWRKDNLPGTLGRTGMGAFLRQICMNPPSGSTSRLYVLTHNDVPAAALLTFYFGQSALYYQAGWDPDSALAAHSPGVVLMAQSIRDAIEHGLKYYEFLRGDEAYKGRWTKSYRKTVTLLCGRSFMGKEYLRACRLKDWIKHRLTPRQSEVTAQIGPLVESD